MKKKISYHKKNDAEIKRMYAPGELNRDQAAMFLVEQLGNQAPQHRFLAFEHINVGG